MRKSELKVKIEAAGFESQAAFARFLQVDIGTVSRWARGYVEVPYTVRLLLDALIANRRRLKN